MIKIALIGMVSVAMAIIFKKGKEEYSFYISLATCILIFYLGMGKLEIILNAINKLKSYINLNQSYMNVLIKIIGITYLTEFSSSIAKDCGYQAIGGQIELVGKLTILAISMPVLLALLETIDSFLTA